MRGSTILYSELLFTDTIPEKQTKGRSKTLIEKRNELLINRHYFFLRNFKFGYEAVLEILEEEFFISPVTIPQIMEKHENQVTLHKLKHNPPSKASLKQKWPHLIWEEKELLLMYGYKNSKKLKVA